MGLVITMGDADECIGSTRKLLMVDLEGHPDLERGRGWGAGVRYSHHYGGVWHRCKGGARHLVVTHEQYYRPGQGAVHEKTCNT